MESQVGLTDQKDLEYVSLMTERPKGEKTR